MIGAAEELGDLHYRLAHESDPVKRASLSARIRALGGVLPASKGQDREADDGTLTGVLARSSPAPSRPVTPTPEPWRTVRRIPVADVLGLQPS